jgi:hypothetical protein
MASTAKSKGKPVVPTAAATQLFKDMGELLEQLPKAAPLPSAAAVRRSLSRMQQQATSDELQALRNVVKELAAQLDRLEIPPGPSGQAGKNPLRKEDEVVQRTLAGASGLAAVAMTTPASVRSGEQFIKSARMHSAEALTERIQRRELVTSGELQKLLGVNRQSLSEAVKRGRLFALLGPSGENYYPAFYGDSELNRRDIERVAKALGRLPPAAKLHFFTSTSTLLQDTPLAALRNGRLDEVLAAAAGYAER